MKKDERKGKVGSDGDLPVKGSMVWWEVLWFRVMAKFWKR